MIIDIFFIVFIVITGKGIVIITVDGIIAVMTVIIFVGVACEISIGIAFAPYSWLLLVLHLSKSTVIFVVITLGIRIIIVNIIF